MNGERVYTKQLFVQSKSRDFWYKKRSQY